MKRCFGHITNPNYKAPHKRKWRNVTSDSDVENFGYEKTDDDSDTEEEATPADTRTDAEKEADSFLNVEDLDAGDEASASDVHFTGEVRAEEQLADVLAGDERPKKRQKSKATRKYRTLFTDIPKPTPLHTVGTSSTPPPTQPPPPPPPFQQPPHQPQQPILQTPVQPQFTVHPSVAQDLSDMKSAIMKLLLFKSEQEAENRLKDEQIAKLQAENATLSLTVAGQSSTIHELQSSNLELRASNLELKASNESLAGKVEELKGDVLRLEGPSHADLDTDECDSEEEAAPEGNKE